MHALGPLVLAGLIAAAAPPDPWAHLAFRAANEQEGRPVASVADRLREAGYRETAAWEKLKDRRDWEKYRDPRLAALRKSLGTFPTPPGDLKVRIRRTLEGDGYRIDNLTFESRPGLVVPANLYRPARSGKAMPGFLIVHSHHAPKTQGELQDMGILWACAGCLVLVMDQLGHGERRQHPFRTQADYPKSFRPSRQDYYFRYNLAIGLQTIGDSLMGWMVWDIQRGIDLLLSRPGIDPKKIILLGAVAGGGDPAAVAGALDRRIAAVVPFNFGGPQPETRFPLPDDAARRFLYSGSGSWESTRNLYRSAADGFLPWVIVGSIAPRKHIYAHEFAWDRLHDPVWKRLNQIHAWYGSKDSLASVHGSGSVRGKPPESTHCTNIGQVHRWDIHVALKQWFGIVAKEPAKPERRPASELLCLSKDDQPSKVTDLAGEIARQRLDRARQRRAKMNASQRRADLVKQWQRLLNVADHPRRERWVEGTSHSAGRIPGARAEYLFGSGVLLLLPQGPIGRRLPITVAFGQGGPQALLRHRSRELERLLGEGSAVALVDLGRSSNTPPGPGRGRTTSATSLASSELMLGTPLLGHYLDHLRNMIAHLREHGDLDPKRVSLWGDSFAPVNTPGQRLEVPLDVPQPHLAEPLGPILALLAALFDENIRSVRVRGGLAGYQSLPGSPFIHVPSDIVVPGVLTAGDLADVVAALAPRPVQIDTLVDGLNHPVSAREIDRLYQVARDAYREAKATQNLRITP
jgi:dienelactone hydrolase